MKKQVKTSHIRLLWNVSGHTKTKILVCNLTVGTQQIGLVTGAMFGAIIKFVSKFLGRNESKKEVNHAVPEAPRD